MFQKLLSNLPFNPSLIGRVTFYTNRLRKETFVRRLGVFFIVAAMGLQLVAIIAPAEPSLAASANDIKYGGFSSKQQITDYCRTNGEFATILNHFGVSCGSLDAAEVGTVHSDHYDGQLYSMGRMPYGKAGETAVDIPGAGRYYMRYLSSWDAPGTTSTYQSLNGTRADGTPFMILFNCGNLTIVGPPVAPPPKVISCNNLFMSVPASSRVPVGTKVNIWGQASGSGIGPNELVDMHYEYVTDQAQLLGTATAIGVPFSGGLATDGTQREFTMSSPGHYFFRLFIRYDGGTQEGVRSFACLKDIYVDVAPPPPVKEVECSALITSFGDKQKILTGTTVTVRGQASGRHVPDGDKVDMIYDYVDSSNKVQGTQKASGVAFKDNAAQDTTPHSFKLDKAGTYKFRLAVKYDNKDASGNQTGNCIKEVIVQPPCEKSKTNDETECIILNKKATNDTQNIPDANNTVARPGDVVTYTLQAKNTSKTTTVKKFVVEEDINDILEYADVVDLHQGVKNEKNIVTWPATDVKPEQTIEKQITIRIKNPLPQTPQSTSNPGSFDMTMTNVYGDTVTIKLPPNVPKTTEQVTKTLPNTGPGETMIVGFVVTIIVGYFFARSRLMVKELDLVRADYAVSGGV